MSRKDVPTKLVIKSYAIYKINHTVKTENKWPYDLLSELTGECIKVCYRAIERDHLKGFIDYGVSLRSGWLTDKGKELLKEIDEDLHLRYTQRMGC